MISAASIREQKVVQSADTTPLSERYGYKSAASPDQLRAAKAFVESLAADLEVVIDDHFIRLRDIGENPYRDEITVGRNHYDHDKVHHGTKVQIFDHAERGKRHAATFSGGKTEKEGKAGKSDSADANAPDADTLFRTAIEELKTKYRSGGFEVLGPYMREGEGSFLVLRDPEYVKAREDFVRAADANALGVARDQKFFGRIMLMLRIKKPYQPLALPAPGPKAPLALPAPLPPAAIEHAAPALAAAEPSATGPSVPAPIAMPAVQAGGFSIAQ